MATWRPRFPLTGSGCRCVPQASSSASAAGSLAPLYFRISRPSVTSVYIHEHIAYTIYGSTHRKSGPQTPHQSSPQRPRPCPLAPGPILRSYCPTPSAKRSCPPPKGDFGETETVRCAHMTTNDIDKREISRLSYVDSGLGRRGRLERIKRPHTDAATCPHCSTVCALPT